MDATPFHRGGQQGWAHDEGHRAGVFHTYDRFDLGFLGPRRIHVFHPRQEGRFATLFVHDGDTAFWPGGPAHATWDIAGTLSARHGQVEPLVVVALHPVERDLEYTHVDWSGGRFPHGQLPRYAAWLAQRVKPWVDAHYPTDPERSAVVGSSHGGLASFWAATRHPEAFRWAGCLSPSFFSGLDPLVAGQPTSRALVEAPLVSEVEELLEDPGRRPKLWICWGTRRDGGPHNAVVEALATARGREMVALLQRRFGYVDGLDLWWKEDEGAGHDEHAWRRRFGEMVQTFFRRP
jgi:pimeloyl-ACP methyl ester carboxylesterase